MSEKGREQARLIAERLKNEKVEAIYCSDLKRAKETAEEIAKFHKLKVIVDKRLKEFDFGDFTPRVNKFEFWPDYKKKESERLGILHWEVKTPNGESEWDHVLRIRSFLEDIKKHKGDIVVVAHGGTNKVFFGAT